jgi:dihydrolipoamide dehydrogenase
MPEPYVIKMPQLSDTMTEGVVVSWEKSAGDKLARGDIVATIETDKAIMDVEVFREGYLSGPLAAIDSVVPVGEPIGYIVASMDEVQATSTSGATTQPARVAAVSLPADRAPQSHHAPRSDNKHATPYARKLAGQMGVNLDAITGTGPDRVIVAEDVLQAQSPARPTDIAPLAAPLELSPVQVSGQGRAMSAMERAVCKNVTASLTMPTFSATIFARPEQLTRAAKRRGVSLTVALAKACAAALAHQPTINWCYQPVDRVVERDFVDIGMAVATETGGLVTPVLRGVHARDLKDLNAEWKMLVERARKQRLKQEEYSNATFQISNLGMYGVAQFNALPTPGLGAILAVAATGEFGMPLTITADHRVINGAQAAQFLKVLKENIEHPDRWLGALGPAIPDGDWDYQVAVIGGGPGGEECARELAGRGVSVIMINDSRFPGGECLWRGCIPSKTWRAAADRMRDRAHDARLGIGRTARAKLDWNRMETTRREILQARGDLALKTDKGVKIKIMQGFASFESGHSLFIDFSANADNPFQRPPPGDHSMGERISFGAAVIATGAPPYLPPLPGVEEGLESGGVLTSDTVWNLTSRPKRLAIIGAGAIGAEMAQMFQDFGTHVTLLEAQPRILVETDAEIAMRLAEILNADPNLSLHTSVKVESISGAPGRMKLGFVDSNGKRYRVSADYVLLATGKRPQLERLNLAAAGVDVANGTVKIDAQGRTSALHVFAVGDAVGGLMLAHTAASQGRIAAAAILGEDARYDQSKDCGVIFTRPQAAFVGLSIEQAKMRGLDAVEIKAPMELDAKAMITGETQGLIKLVVDRQAQRIVGVHMLADHADALIGEAVLMVAGDMSLKQVGDAVHPHPTQTEIFNDLARRLIARLCRSRAKTSVS